MEYAIGLIMIVSAFGLIFFSLKLLLIYLIGVTVSSLIIGVSVPGEEGKAALFVGYIILASIVSFITLNGRLKLVEKLEISDNILNKINNLVVVSNSEGKIIYVSPSSLEILGYASEELLGESWWQLTVKNTADAPTAREYFLKLLKEENFLAQTSFDGKLKRKDGAIRLITWKVSIISNDFWVGVGFDITERNRAEKALMQLNLELQLKNKDITDSIKYAQRLQEAILHSRERVKKLFPDSFLFLKPKDIVNGDLFWCAEVKENGKSYRLIAAIDCTGHGVPGAFMTIIAMTLLEDIIIDKGITKPSEVLKKMKEEVIRLFTKEGEDKSAQDGMDIALCKFDAEEMKLEYAGAFNSIYLIQDKKFREIKADKSPIGFEAGVLSNKEYNNHQVDIKKGDVIYMFSDGYADQFGGPLGKKFKYNKFEELLLSVHQENMKEQHTILKDTIEKWIGEQEQVDDILVIGIRV